MNITLQSLLPWRRPKLDPERSQAVRRTFDETSHYAAWSAYCRAHMARPVGASPSDELPQHGFEILPVLTAAEAATAKATILAHGSMTRASKRDVDYSDVMQFDDCAFLLSILERIFSPAMDARLVAHFHSEYFVYSFAVIRTVPAAIARRSFLWHSDRGPKDFLRLNLFLDATMEHGSTTEFVDRRGSAALERLGYTFGPNSRRVANLEPLARRTGIEVRPVHPDVKAGEALLFEAANVLHRGILPHRGARHVLSMMLIPSPVPWKTVWAVTACSRAAEENRGRWAPDASGLFHMIGIEPPSDGLQAWGP